MWHGRTAAKLPLHRSDFSPTALGAGWSVMGVVALRQLPDDIPQLFPVVISAFVVAGLALALVRPVYVVLRRRRTAYALTDRRAIIVESWPKRQRSVPHLAETRLAFRRHGDGSGTLRWGGTSLGTFADLVRSAQESGRTSMQRASPAARRAAMQPLEFFRVPDGEVVHDLVLALCPPG